MILRKNNLYINDGTYGSLFDAGGPNFILPSKMITNGRVQSKKLTAFSFFGPTCDGLDYMKGPFLLPNNIKEGDYIELGQLVLTVLLLELASTVFIQMKFTN